MGFWNKFKKIFLIIGFLGLTILFGYLLWRFFFQSAISPTEPGSETNNLGGLSPAGEGSGNFASSTGSGRLDSGEDDPDTVKPGGLTTAPTGNEPDALAVGGKTKTTAVTKNPVLDPTMSNDGQLRYYDRNDGKFYKLDNNGELIALSDKVFYQVQDVTWSVGGEKAILEYPDGSKISYDFNTKKQVTLPKHWEDFSFSPDSNKISAKSIGDDIENRWLIVANADGSRAASLSAIGKNADDVYPIWSPNNQAAAMYTKGVDFDRQEVFFVGLNDENFKSTIINGRGFEPQWSDTGDRLLYSVYNSDNNMNPSLWIVEAQGDNIGQNRKNLGLNTWASKCTFATNSEIYCAVPTELPKGAGLFPELADRTSDNLYKIDLKTGAKKLIALPENATNVSSIMVGEQQEKLYFTDKNNGLIYEIKLK